METIGKRIKNLRLKLGLTAEELGSKINKNRATVYRYENANIEKLPITILEPLAKALNTTPSYIMGIEPLEKNSNLTEQITSNVEKLTTENKEKTLDYTEKLLNIQNKIQEDEVYYNYVPFYGYASAGTGQPIYDTPIETVKIKGYVPRHDLALLTSGDSMEPLYKNGDVIFIDKTPEIQNGQIGVFILDGECFVKKLRIDEYGTIRLVSLNKKYKDITINEYSNFSVVGKVVM